MKFFSFLLFMIWVLNPANLTAQSFQNSAAGDLAALKAFYNATDGDNWTNSWDINSMTSSNMGSFYGVTTGSDGRVTALAMNGNESYNGSGAIGGNNLVGTLPPEIGNLTKLTYFNVKHNQLSGELPWHAFNNMVFLKYLLLNGSTSSMTISGSHHPGKAGTADASDTNKFVGQISNSLLKLVDLEWLELAGHERGESIGLDGDIPNDFLANSSEMLGLFLHRNGFTSFPPTIGYMTKLTNINFSGNLYSGSFPFDASGLKSIRNIRWGAGSGTGITGPVPVFGGSSLRLIILNGHNFSGGLPEYLVDGTHPFINSVYFSGSGLSGELPKIAPQFDPVTGKQNHNIGLFNLNGNNFTGEIPAHYATNFRSGVNIISLGWNNLEGEMPQDWSAYTSLRYLRVNGNNLTGSIPTKLPNTRHLYFHDNNFTSFNAQSLINLWDEHNRLEQVFIDRNSIPESDIEPAIGPMEDAEVDFRYGDQNAGSGGGGSGGDGDDGNDDDDWNPDAPDNIFPSNSSNNVSAAPGFEWSTTGADYYILNVRRTGSSQNIINTEVEGTSFTPSENLQHETTYRWRVRSVEDGEQSDWSSEWTFTTESDSNSSSGGGGGNGKGPKKSSPSDDEKNVSKKPTFRWESVEDAESYTIEISSTESSLVLIEEEIYDTLYTPGKDFQPNTKYEWRVRATINGNADEWSDTWSFTTVSENSEFEFETELSQNYPNPFNPTTQIRFTISEAQQVSLKVYDMAGRLVANLVDNSSYSAGSHEMTFNANSLASGIYFYRFITEREIVTRKMTLMK